jgi:hypothetical protein
MLRLCWRYAVQASGEGLVVSSRSRTATTAGVFFLITEVSAVAGLLLYLPALTDAGYVGSGGDDGRILLGAMSELVLVLAIVGCAVTLYPVVRRQNEAMALAQVCGRLLEATIITVGMVSVLAVITLRQDGAAAGTDEASLVAVGQSLVAVHDWTFLVGPTFFLGANSLLLAYLVYLPGGAGGPLLDVLADDAAAAVLVSVVHQDEESPPVGARRE